MPKSSIRWIARGLLHQSLGLEWVPPVVKQGPFKWPVAQNTPSSAVRATNHSQQFLFQCSSKQAWVGTRILCHITTWTMLLVNFKEQLISSSLAFERPLQRVAIFFSWVQMKNETFSSHRPPLPSVSLGCSPNRLARPPDDPSTNLEGLKGQDEEQSTASSIGPPPQRRSDRVALLFWHPQSQWSTPEPASLKPVGSHCSLPLEECLSVGVSVATSLLTMTPHIPRDRSKVPSALWVSMVWSLVTIGPAVVMWRRTHSPFARVTSTSFKASCSSSLLDGRSGWVAPLSISPLPPPMPMRPSLKAFRELRCAWSRDKTSLLPSSSFPDLS